MTARRLATGLAPAVLFTGFVVWLFPVDLLARRLLGRLAGAGMPAIVFARATLRPGGILLEDVTVRGKSGVALAHAAWVRLRPSAWGLVRDGSGLPWTVDAELCEGRAEATIAADAQGTAVTVTWHDAELAACPPLEIAGGALAGRAHGVARLRLVSGGPPTGTGDVDLAAGTWQATGPLGALGPLHAESASLRWTLRDGQLALDAVQLRGPEVSASGDGTVELADPLAESVLQLHLALAPAPDVRGALGLLLRLSGDPTATRRLLVGGTLARPSALLQ
jgi:type II secretion system protein N